MWIIAALIAALLTPPPAAAAVIHVDATGTGRTVSPYLFGVNDRFAYHGMGAFDPTLRRHYETFAEQASDVGVTMVRFPGGTVANTYHWQRAIGPNRTANAAGQPSGLPLDNDFGPDEYGAFLERIHAVGNLMLNATTSTVDEVADFVEYMVAPWWTNPGGGTAWGQVRADNGHAAPYPIKMVEIGNELRMPDQRYWHAGESLDPNCRNECLYLHGGTTVMPPEPALAADGAFYARWTPIVAGSQTVYIDGSPVDGYTFDPASGRITFPAPPQGKVTVAYTSGPHPGFKDYYSRIKSQFPQLQVCSNYDTDEAIRQFAAYPYDCLIKHVYVLDSQLATQPPADADDYFGRVLTRMRVPLARTAELQKAIGSRGLYLTEYGHSGRRPDRFQLGLGAAIVEAAFLKGFMELGIPVAQKHALTDYVFSPQPPGTIGLSSEGSVIAGPGPHTVITPAGLAMKLMESLAFGQICASRTEGVPIRTLSNGDMLPALEVIAARDVANVLHIVVINQDPRAAVTATVKLDNYRMAGPGLVQTLSSASYLDYNSPQEPTKVSIVDTPLFGLTQTFPAHSITKMIVLPG